MHNNKWVELTVGLFTVAGIVALITLTLQATNFSQFAITDVYTIKANFENISGLKSRSAVSIAGVNIGRVKDISIDPETFEAVVSMEINKEHANIPEDSSISVYTAGLLGEKYLGITVGGAPEYLKDGSLINFTQSSIVLEEMISKFLLNQTNDANN